MTTNNSLVEFYSALVVRLITDVADCYVGDDCIHKSLLRDRQEIANRVKSQGISFLTEDMPRLAKALDTALGNNKPFEVPSGFLARKDSVLPEFLGGLFGKVLNNHGLSEPTFNLKEAYTAVYHIRQILYTLYKLRLPYEKDKTEKVIQSFIQTDSSLVDCEVAIREDTSGVIRTAANIAVSIFGNLPFREITPRHGPGSVATGENVVEKSQFGRIYTALDKVYPFTEYFMFNLNHVCDDYRRIQRLPEIPSGTTKVAPVDKDSRGPRLISSEPLEYQWIQQGLADLIVSRLESHKLTKGRVNFTDQNVNRELALEGSKTGKWVTLDMKEASDRVSTELVKAIFHNCPVLEALLAARSTHAKLPDGTVMYLNKYAPMGSALCFPVEAFIFWALAVSVIMRTYGYSLKQAARIVFVYGDDIITTSEVYEVVMQQMLPFGLLFNTAKCCTAGFFRESCGCEAFHGLEVTPTRLRAVYVSELTYNPDVLMGFVAFHNAMYLKGYYRMCKYVADYLDRTWGSLPRVYPNDGMVIGWSRDSAVTYDIESERGVHGRTMDCEYSVAALCTLNALNLTKTSTLDKDFRVFPPGKRKFLPWRWYRRVWIVISKKDETTFAGYPEMLRRTCCGNWLTGPMYTPRRGAGLYRRWKLWTEVRGS